MSVQQIVNEWKERGQPLIVPKASTRIWREGKGDVVVCLHGLPASGYLYRKVLPALANKNLQGVTFDLPGTGFADRSTDFNYSWSSLSQWVVNALDAAGIDSFHLVVHDLGGPIGFDVVSRIPERILSLTVLNTLLFVVSFRRPWVMEPFAHRGLGWVWIQMMRTPLFLVLMRRIAVQGGPSDDELRAYRELLLRQDNGRSFLKIMRSFEQTNQYETRIIGALKQRQFPAQVIWGADDPALSMQDYAPDICRVLGLTGWQRVAGKHFLQEDSPKEIAAYVSNLAVSNDLNKDEH